MENTAESTVTIHTDSPEKTRELGRHIGRHIVSGIRIALKGELGCGKTRLVQGIAGGLDVPDDYAVTSPSYTLINEYPGRLRLFHVDLYRLESVVDFEDIGLIDLLGGDDVVVVEWAERLDPDDLGDHVVVNIRWTGETTRTFDFIGCGLQAGNLVRNIEIFRKG